MPRARVLSFMTQWGNGVKSPFSSAPSSPNPNNGPVTFHPEAERSDAGLSNTIEDPEPGPSKTGPASMVIAYNPPMMETTADTPPELAPIFSFLNSHANKLYQEGYFLKLHDLDSRGRPSADRIWVECFAQLVGTVLSLWDAGHLDAAGEDGEVVPTFINLTDASIKMIESLPMHGVPGQQLQNVLSISTAANNRYLLHFNSLHSLTQWTAGIRLAMYEHSTLQEAYTGSIIAGKGKNLNNIKNIMERARFPTEDWVRVRFGAGTPWRRCWCVISPPTEKDIAHAKKAEKAIKKKSAYDRSPQVAKGDIKFYENRKVTKKTKPIATITDAFSAYGIYPQNKDLIDQSTLLKVEGQITIHSEPPSTTEGFVFIMPEVHPMISGFEMLLRFLMPTFDVFTLYGRPDRLIADSNNMRSLMFAMPSSKRYGYLELIDVAGLIHAEGSSKWSEREWRKQMKQLTSKRMAQPAPGSSRTPSIASHRRTASRSSLNLPNAPVNRSLTNLSAPRPTVRFGDDNAFRSTPSSRTASPAPSADAILPVLPRAESPLSAQSPKRHHQRSASDATSYTRTPVKSRLSVELNHTDSSDSVTAPQPPQHGVPARPQYAGPYDSDRDATPELDGGAFPDQVSRPPIEAVAPARKPIAPIAAPPQFVHNPRAQPPVKPGVVAGMREATNNLDPATLAQLHDVTTPSAEPRPQPYFTSPHSAGMASPDLSYYQNAPLPPVHQPQSNGGYTIGSPMYAQGFQSSSATNSPQISDLDMLANAPGMPSMGLPIRSSTSNTALRQTPSQSSFLGPPQQQGLGLSSGTVTPRRSNMGMQQTLPTIPGTPAAMEQNFQLGEPLQPSRSRDSSRNRNSFERKPVGSGSARGSRGPSPAGR